MLCMRVLNNNHYLFVLYCLIIGTFNNDGTFTNSQINESVSGCNSTTDTRITEIIVFVILLIIVIAIIIYYIYSSYYNSNTSNTPNIPYNNDISYSNAYNVPTT